MKNVMISAILTIISSVSFAASSGSFHYNPTNDPKKQAITGNVSEKLSVQYCGAVENSASINEEVQGETTFSVSTNDKVTTISGNYSFLNNVMYLKLDETTETAIIASIKAKAEQLCNDGGSIDDRSITISKTMIKTYGEKKVDGYITVKAYYARKTDILVGGLARGVKTGVLTYTIRVSGKLIQPQV